MQAQQLNLRDIHIPDAIGWWPPAIGWWLLILVIAILIAVIFYLYQRFTRKTAVKTAKKLLAEIKQNPALDAQKKLAAISALLRRTAISLSPEQHVANLSGLAWLQYLDSTVKGSPFTSGPGKALAYAHYQKKPAADLQIDAIISICEDWLKAQKDNS